jgi:photosystem II stability/assembly factor-like uncharacterized protein
MRLAALALSSTLVASALVPSVAFANGRFPQAQQLVVDPSDPNHITVQTTYGFIDTANHGKDWRWICEAAVGYGGTLDPPIAILGDSTLIAGVFDGLAVSSDKGCTFAKAQATGTSTCQSTLSGFAGRFVVDVARQASDPTHAIAISSNGCGMDLFDTRLWSTTDNAKTWTQSGMPLPQSFLALTADSAPTTPSTVYVSGFRVVSATDYRGALATTTDGGATWNVVDIPNSVNTSAPYIAAIDPNDAKTIYVRLASDQGQLLVTHDAGATYTMVLQAKGLLLGFALSPDGKTVVTGGETDGVLSASTSDFKFTQVSAIQNRCLTWSGSSIFACAKEAIDGFSIGVSTDGGHTWTPLHHLSCLEGPVGCSATSDVSTQCPGPWEVTQQSIQTNMCPTNMTSSSSTSSGTGKVMPRGGCSLANASSEEMVAPWLAVVGALGALTRRRARKS